MKGRLLGSMDVQRLREVADLGGSMRAEERCWCIDELTGPLADWAPCSKFHEASDQMLARCLLRAWLESTRCDCED